MKAPVTAFLRHLEVEKNASPHTLRSYRADLLDFEAHLAKQTLLPATADLRAMDFDPADITIQRSLDLRYRFQCHELNVAFSPGTEDLITADLERFDAAFDETYEKQFGPGSGYRDAGKEIVTFRVTATGRIRKPALHRQALVPASAASAKKGERPVFFEAVGDFAATALYAFESMTPAMTLKGPAVIESPVTTIVVGPNDTAIVDEFYNVRLALGARESR